MTLPVHRSIEALEIALKATRGIDGLCVEASLLKDLVEAAKVQRMSRINNSWLKEPREKLLRLCEHMSATLDSYEEMNNKLRAENEELERKNKELCAGAADALMKAGNFEILLRRSRRVMRSARANVRDWWKQSEGLVEDITKALEEK
jgi:hypothetical protein